MRMRPVEIALEDILTEIQPEALPGSADNWMFQNLQVLGLTAANVPVSGPERGVSFFTRLWYALLFGPQESLTDEVVAYRPPKLMFPKETLHFLTTAVLIGGFVFALAEIVVWVLDESRFRMSIDHQANPMYSPRVGQPGSEVITGRVVDFKTRLPIRNATVTLFIGYRPGPVRTIVDRDGFFRFELDESDSRLFRDPMWLEYRRSHGYGYLLEVGAPGYETYGVGSLPDSSTVLIRLRRKGTVSPYRYRFRYRSGAKKNQ